MRRREAIVATATVTTGILAGCLDGVTSANEGDEEGQEQGRTVIVSDAGDVDGEPDLAILRVDVESMADNVQNARTELARGAEELTDALVAYGIDEENITTERYRISKRIDRRRMEEAGVRPDDPEAAEEYTYYRGTHSFSVEIANVDEVGDVIDVAATSGADEIGRVTYTLSEEKQAELREEAMRNALQDARAEAEVIADEIGAEVVEATIVDASDAQVSPVRMDAGDVALEPAATPSPDAEPPTDIGPGEVTVTAHVDVRYEIE